MLTGTRATPTRGWQYARPCRRTQGSSRRRNSLGDPSSFQREFDAQRQEFVVSHALLALLDNSNQVQYNATYMSPRTASTFRLEDDLLDGLRQVKERDGIPISEQVRRALKAWLDARGIQKVDRKRAISRKRL
jgi:hypothetical protein